MSDTGTRRFIRTDHIRDAERWRFASLAERETTNDALDTANTPALQRQTAEYRLGFKEGHETGRLSGIDEGRRAGEAQHAAICTIAAGMQAQFARLESDVAERLVSLALTIAENIVRSELQCRPEACIDLVQSLLKDLHQRLGNGRLRLHPLDAVLLPTAIVDDLAARGCRIETDEGILRGGCILEADELEIDATLEKRWDQVRAAMGYPGSRA